MKDTIKRMKSQATGQEKISTDHMSDKDVSESDKELD